MKHFTISEEVNGNCECGSRTILMTPMCPEWNHDSEPIKSGEYVGDLTDEKEIEAIENLPDCVDLGIELSVHYCPSCESVVSFSLNM